MSDDRHIPRPALALGLAGLIPFVWSAATSLSLPLTAWAADVLSPMFLGRVVGISYGVVILSFMSGALWGFATRADRATAPIAYALSVIPALWAFAMVTDATETSVIFLAAGFLGVLLIDVAFAGWHLAPRWWLRLRVLLTAGVLACLLLPLAV